MNQETIKLSIKRVFIDRPFLVLMAELVFVAVIYCLVTLLNIHPSDVTVYSRYTAFGEAHFYKAHWQYMLLFVGYGVFVTAAHLALMVKLHSINRRQTAVLVGYIGISMLLVACAYALSVMQLGRSA